MIGRHSSVLQKVRRHSKRLLVQIVVRVLMPINVIRPVHARLTIIAMLVLRALKHMDSATPALERAASARTDQLQAVIVAPGHVREPYRVLAKPEPVLFAKREVARTQVRVTLVGLRSVVRNVTIVSDCF